MRSVAAYGIADERHDFVAQHGNPHGRARALHGHDVQLHVVDAVVFPRVREPLARPRAQDDVQRFVEPLALRGGLDAEAGVLVAQVSRADAEVEASVRQDVDHRVVLGRPQRVIERQDDHPGPETDPARALRCRRHPHGRARDGAVLVKVMLGDPEGVESEGIGRFGLFEELAVEAIHRARQLVRVVVDDGEDPDLHRRQSMRSPRPRATMPE
jgi:hypothetical protein